MVACFEGCACSANGVYNAHALVAQYTARRAGWHIAFQDVQVGTANGGIRNPHDGVACSLQDRHGAIFQSFNSGAAINHLRNLLKGTISGAPTDRLLSINQLAVWRPVSNRKRNGAPAIRAGLPKRLFR